MDRLRACECCRRRRDPRTLGARRASENQWRREKARAVGRTKASRPRETERRSGETGELGDAVLSVSAMVDGERETGEGEREGEGRRNKLTRGQARPTHRPELVSCGAG